MTQQIQSQPSFFWTMMSHRGHFMASPCCSSLYSENIYTFNFLKLIHGLLLGFQRLNCCSHSLKKIKGITSHPAHGSIVPLNFNSVTSVNYLYFLSHVGRICHIENLNHKGALQVFSFLSSHRQQLSCLQRRGVVFCTDAQVVLVVLTVHPIMDSLSKDNFLQVWFSTLYLN